MTLQLQDNTINDMAQMRQLTNSLMKMPHYAKMGEQGIFAIVQKAKAMNLDPIEALNGGMYFVQGKVEMQGQMMLSLIRQAGHSVSMDPKSTDTHVTMRGKRADNGDMWIVDFSIEDAKRAGIYRGQWEKYPKTMCIWRCVSMLGRFLFPDVIKGCYVKGEISESIPFDEPVHQVSQEIIQVQNEEANNELKELYNLCDSEYQEKVMAFIKTHLNVSDLKDVPSEKFNALKRGMINHLATQKTHYDKPQGEVVEEPQEAVS